MDRLADYDYPVPEELIAATPLPRREDARLLVVDRRTGGLEHRTVRDLPELLRPLDCLILNDTQVLPARLLGRRTATGGKWEGLFLSAADDGTWRLLGQSRGRLKPGESITILPAHDPGSGNELVLTLLDCDSGGVWRARPEAAAPAFELLQRFGTVPLPPYLRRKQATAADRERYQTIYARHPGSVAAPTAGLHLSGDLLAACESRGVRRAFVTLHVGVGTFRPISVEDLSAHQMHEEWCAVPAETARTLQETRRRGGRIVAVGTTSVRTLESAAREGTLGAWEGTTDLFIRPPYTFRAVDCLLTNFHLPRSSLLVLVSVLAGVDLIRRAYECAVRERYRFYSYGDAMLIL